MVTRGRPAARKPARRATTARKPAASAAKPTTTAKRPAVKAKAAAPAKPNTPDVTVYADKEPTGYHKAFANWIVKEVGYDPNEATSKRAAFLAGVRIATAARPAFQQSEYLEEWREKSGEAKRGPKTADAKRKATREVVSDDEFEDEGDDFEDADEDFEDESEEDSDEFEDDEESDEDDEDSEEDDDESDDEDDDDFEDEPEPPKRRGRPAKAAPARRTARPAAKKPTTPARRSKSTADDEDLF